MWKLSAISAALIAAVFSADECPTDQEMVCVDDFKKALPYCKKAEEEKGKDFDADINCLKYAYAMEKDCWPCICFLAEKEHLKIRGCSKSSLRIE